MATVPPKGIKSLKMPPDFVYEKLGKHFGGEGIRVEWGLLCQHLHSTFRDWEKTVISHMKKFDGDSDRWKLWWSWKLLPVSHVISPPPPHFLSHPSWGLVFNFELKKKNRPKSEGKTCNKGQVEEKSRTS